MFHIERIITQHGDKLGLEPGFTERLFEISKTCRYDRKLNAIRAKSKFAAWRSCGVQFRLSNEFIAQVGYADHQGIRGAKESRVGLYREGLRYACDIRKLRRSFRHSVSLVT